jgi:starch synthase (maltosyl-transferring)
LNAIRRANPALQSDATLKFRPIDNDQLICYSKHSADGTNVILVVVNLDPHHAQSGFIDVPLEEWGLDAQNPYLARELLADSRYEWQGARVFVTLAPAECPACVYRIEARRTASERDFDYFV